MNSKEFMDSLEFSDEEVPEDQLPPRGTPVMVVRSLRLPVPLEMRIKDAVAARGVPASTLIREWIELGLAALEQDQPISRAEALRALAALRPADTAPADTAPADPAQRSS